MSGTPFSAAEKREILRKRKEANDKRLKEIMAEMGAPMKPTKPKTKKTGY